MQDDTSDPVSVWKIDERTGTFKVRSPDFIRFSIVKPDGSGNTNFAPRVS